jgi:hypothetical protein
MRAGVIEAKENAFNRQRDDDAKIVGAGLIPGL